ncbi:MAG: hypothetical protein JRJ84_16735 [Deltaproteobacteria bacterium]|nr:hypothetical protein [Deltaproteobacteria bacterium]
MRIPLFTAAVVLITSLACGGAPAPAPEDKVEASAEPAAVVVTIPNLRFDGVYRSEGDETSRYLRLYPDGHVSSVSSTATSEQVANWLGREHDASSQGTATHGDGRIAFTATDETGDVEYSGTMEPDGTLALHWKSHINDAEGDMVYTFVPVELKAP